MYKLFLGWRFLWTRWLPVASIVSVMLGVGTLIVVNSVMSGFATKLMNRIRGLHADVVIEHRSHEGMARTAEQVARVKQILGPRVVAVSPVIETFGMLQYNFKRYYAPISRPVRVIGIDPATKSQTGEFAKTLRNSDHQADPARAFEIEGEAEENHRRYYYEGTPGFSRSPALPVPGPDGKMEPDHALPPTTAAVPPPEAVRLFGACVGHGVAHYRNPKAKVTDAEKDIAMMSLGDEITLMLLSSGEAEGMDGQRGIVRPVTAKFVVADFFKTEMSEFDSNIIYVHIDDLRRLRAMPDRASSLHLKLANFDRDAQAVVEELREAFPEGEFVVQTWIDRQGPLMSAIAIERAILNVLLFLIIAVAGFGILAIFFMIVTEKMRDIGILKALGASNTGVMGIFLSYGLVLGLVGAVLGTVGGIAFTLNINEIEQSLALATGQEVFKRDIYYFDKIPTDLQPMTILSVNLGALLIAVAASVLPAWRAAWLHPVQALRYE